MNIVDQHGQGFDIYNTGTEGSVNGSGGGWNYSSLVKNEQSGNSYIAGAYGGLTCKNYAKWYANITFNFIVSLFFETGW